MYHNSIMISEPSIAQEVLITADNGRLALLVKAANGNGKKTAYKILKKEGMASLHLFWLYTDLK